MKTNNYIDSVIKFIENNLSNDINPESIANNHFISLSQLYRDFYSCTGHSVKEYIRKRRISNACEKIKCSDLPLDVIANESGYQTQQAFHKQFKNTLGLTPLDYKQSDTYFYFYPYSVNDISFSIKVGTETIPECAITKYYDSCLLGIEDKAIATLGEIEGRVFGRHGKQTGNRFCYEMLIERGRLNCDHPGKTGTYATCVMNYNEIDINAGWNYLYNIWLSASMFEQSEEGYFEEYLFRRGKPYKLKLYLPVKKRRNTQQIAISSMEEMNFIIARAKGSNAERKASEKVVEFMSEHYPIIIRNARRFYMCTYNDICECGIECSDTFLLPKDSYLEKLHIPGGMYAILPDDCLGDISVGISKMRLWLTRNCIAYEGKPVFAIYETQAGEFDNCNTQMKLYKQLKNDKIG